MHSDETLVQSLRKIQLEWGLSHEQMAALAHVSLPIYESWLSSRQECEVNVEQASIPSGMETAVPVLSIYRSLCVLHPNTEDQAKWLLSDNPHFSGNKPMDVAASSLENLYWVAYYLDSFKGLQQPSKTD